VLSLDHISRIRSVILLIILRFFLIIRILRLSLLSVLFFILFSGIEFFEQFSRFVRQNEVDGSQNDLLGEVKNPFIERLLRKSRNRVVDLLGD